MLSSFIISSSFWIWLMMHCVEEVSPQLQPIQVLTGLRLLAPCSNSRYPCTLRVRESRLREQSRGCALQYCSAQMWKYRAVCKLVQTFPLFLRGKKETTWKCIRRESWFCNTGKCLLTYQDGLSTRIHT